MEYNRLVAYIYSYNSGLKNRNVGFARLEIRNDNIKMSINMKNAVAESYSIWNVCLFYRENDSICGIKLGEMIFDRDTEEFTYSGPALNIENSNKSFNDIRGIYMLSGNNKSYMFASEWDDLGFAPEKIVLQDRLGSSDVELRVAEQTVPYMAEVQNEYAAQDEPEMTDAAEMQDEPDISDIPGMQDEPEMPATPDENNMNSEPDETTELDRMWERISDRRERLFIFADDELYDVIEINPDDIDKMPNTNWHLRNNSFLNHGYFNFRHLIAGKMRTEDGTGYFIGVPGIYNRRERNLASMYGFNHFKFSMRSDMRLNQFGYWYREITD